jgi:copper transport protein
VIHARRAALAVLFALSILAAEGAVVAAHALLLSSSPAANAVLTSAPASVALTFTEPPDPRLSSVRVLDVSGVGHTTGPAVLGSGGSNTLTAPLGPLADGVYTVAWRTVSAADGHATAGSFAFSVGTGVPPPSAPPGAAPPESQGASTVSTPSVLARAVLYLGLVVLLGSLLTGEVLLGGRARSFGRVRAAAWTAAMAGALALLGAQAADAGVDLTDALTSSLGMDAAGRVVPLIAAGAAMLVAARSSRWRRAATLVAAALVALALLADAAASHASSTIAPPLNIVLQWLHAVGVSVWLGGLAGILVELRRPDLDDRARLTGQFSRWATVGILVVALTGVARAAFELHGLDELVSTEYGRLLLIKLVLFAGLGALGAVNHFRHVPGGEGAARPLRRIGSVELLLGATAIVVASVLVTTPPPADITAGGTTGPTPGASASAAPSPTAPSAASATFKGADYATTVKIALTVTPNVPGPATFSAAVTDYDTGAAVPATGVKLRFALPALPDVGPSSLALTPAAGEWSGQGSNLSLAGLWSVTVVVTEASTAVEVPIAVTVAPPTGPPDVSRVAGQPTLYTVHLTDGNQAQLYLDPISADLADLHVTYFDAAGKELPVTSIAVDAAQAGGPPTRLAMSPIEPGHATAKVPTTSGIPISLFVSGTATDGSSIAFGLIVTPDE